MSLPVLPTALFPDPGQQDALDALIEEQMQRGARRHRRSQVLLSLCLALIPLELAGWGWLTLIADDACQPWAAGAEFKMGFAVEALLTATLVGAYAGWWYRRAARQPNVLATLKTDERPPALWLRSFAEEAKWYRFLQTTTFEQVVAGVLSAVGPIIAIQRPNERYPQIGAGKIVVPTMRWQEVVLHLLRSAGFVTITVTSMTDGVLWELKQAFAHVDPHRLLLLVRGPVYRDLADRSGRLFPKPLPMRDDFVLNRFGLLFVQFADDWSPCVRMDPPGWTIGERIHACVVPYMQRVGVDSAYIKRTPDPNFRGYNILCVSWLFVSALVLLVPQVTSQIAHRAEPPDLKCASHDSMTGAASAG